MPLTITEAVERLKDNEGRFDAFVNGTGYTTTGGQPVESVPEFLERVEGEIEQTTGAVAANLEASQAARAGAEAARDAAVLSGHVYQTAAAGLAATTNGQYFSVPSGASNEYLILYLNSSGAAVETKRYPSAQVVDLLRREAQDFENELGALKYGALAEFVGSGDVVPLITDRANRVILGYSKSKQALVSLDFGEGAVRTTFGNLSFGEYVGSGDVYPLLVDAADKVLLGYNAAQDRIVGAGLGESAVPAASEFEDLPEQCIPSALNQVIAYGQSLSVGAQGRPPVSTSQPYGNLTFQGGPRAYNGTSFAWAPLKPLVEDQVSPAPDGLTNRGETVCSGAANYATTLRAMDGHAPDSHVILASAAGYGGASISFLEKGTSWYNNTFLSHISQAHAINPNHSVHAVFWMQGENDGGGMSYATYKQKFNKLVGDMEADAKVITGQTSPVYTLTYQTCTNSAAWRQIQQAQLDVAKTAPKAFLVTPIYHMPHVSDAVHLNAVGYKWVGAYFGRAYKLLLDGKKPRWLDPVSATLRGVELRVRFSVPYRPLCLDKTTLASTTDCGFRVQAVADDVAVPINKISVDGDDVVLHLTQVPQGPATVRYAMDYLGSGLNIVGAGSGNVRDSDPASVIIGGQSYPLYNVAPHFELPVIAVGE